MRSFKAADNLRIEEHRRAKANILKEKEVMEDEINPTAKPRTS